MGEAKNRSRSQKKILERASRCIYCTEPPATIEHMPPLAMFRDRARPSGMEYPACESCNRGTSTADLVACLMAHIAPFDGAGHWRIDAARRFVRHLRREEPGLAAELMRSDKATREWLRAPNGLFRETHRVNADGPILKRHMDIFSAKLGMAIFYEHIGAPLPSNGAVCTTWFLNAGLTVVAAEAILSILPAHATLRQGTKVVSEQFAYRYNTDDKTVVAALSGFHNNLHILTIATSEAENIREIGSYPNAVTTTVGGLVTGPN